MSVNEPCKCIFCDIVAGRAPARTVHEDDKSLCILDILPYTRALPGHTQRHVDVVARMKTTRPRASFPWQ
jgi:hypothetical protein